MSPSPTRLCPKCAVEVRDGWRVCPACATPLQPGDADTKTIYRQSSSVSTVEEGRFPAGTVLAGRYRVLGLIGQGGMGEVYRAYDLILNQAVALKFLGQASMSEATLVRFRNEVRIARQVSHPNVCRVYDIGFIEGFHFLSMEYLDGEDLASLIRRIGRLPQDKAIEFARKICAGLAAAHERGVLHRDLKPANIMIDGRGQVRITDFGLAALAQEVAVGDIRSGTPAYMAPEQKAGKEVTTRSDLYSLGLTLYEMFTGKRRGSTQTNPTDIVKDLDPAIERILLRCLEEDPRRRPSSALSVAMALPGGDPIAAALAAGETPSPEMVAASGEKEGFSARTAILCFAGIVASTAIWFLPPLNTTRIYDKAAIDIPPDALVFRAQDILKEFKYTEKPRSIAWGFDCCDGPNLRFVEQFAPARRDTLLATHQPPIVRFWYRQSQSPLAPDALGGFGPYSWDSPPNSEPKMIRMALDATGRLIALEARPAEGSQTSVTSSPFNWTVLFKEAQLDPARFRVSDPRRTPPTAFDARMAWVGTYDGDRPEQIRLEAAAWQGRPVYLDISGEWRKAGDSTDQNPPALAVIWASLFVVLLAGGALVARLNLRLGRGDKKGAAKIAAASFLSGFGSFLLASSHVAGIDEIRPLIIGMSFAGFISTVLWLAYIGTEPYMRRHWPDSLISWNRFLSGKLRDPLVASHILAGIFVFWAWGTVSGFAVIAASAPPFVPGGIQSLGSTASFAATLLRMANGVLIPATGYLLLMVLLRLVLRRVWIADLATALVFVAGGLAVDYSNPYRFALTGVVYLLGGLAFLWLLRNLGFLAGLAFWLANDLVISVPPAPLTSWYVGYSLVAQGLAIAVSGWALWVILSAQKHPSAEAAS